MDLRSWPAKMGVAPGDRILLMADVTRLAWSFRKANARFKPEDLIDAFLALLGPEGTLIVPTFNFDLQPGENFDLRRTPTITGALGNAALAHHAFARTGNALHSFAVAGALRSEFLAIDPTSSFGLRSPFALLNDHAFRVIAIDMPLEPAFSYVHHVEERMNVWYRKLKRITIRYTERDGRTLDREFELFAKRPGFVNDFKELEPLLGDALAQRTIDGSNVLIVDLRKAHPVIENDIRNNRARRIVRFRWKWWLRDQLRPLLKKAAPSRSAKLTQDAAGTH